VEDVLDVSMTRRLVEAVDRIDARERSAETRDKLLSFPNIIHEDSAYQTRKVVWYGYSYRWLRPKDQMTVAHLYPQLDPIRRQILGDGLSANGTYDPTDGDVPLRAWLREHDPESADWSHHGRSQSRPPAMVRGKNLGRQ
jgi:hypothetical protein